MQNRTLPLTEERAREIMGKNVFGVSDAIFHFGITPISRNNEFSPLRTFGGQLITEEILLARKDTDILIADFGASINDLRKFFSREHLFRKQGWYDASSFAKERGEIGWHLLRKEPVPGTCFKTSSEQNAMLIEGEIVPTARVVVYAILGHFLTTGKILLEHAQVRCRDVLPSEKYYRGGPVPHTRTVAVGSFIPPDKGGDTGLRIDQCGSGIRYNRIGLASEIIKF